MTKLLICDDSSFARKQIMRALPSDWAFELSQAAHGGEAMDMLRAAPVDAMILDLNMPVMDGYQVLQALADENIPARVVVVSGDIQPEARARVERLGALAFIKKPVDCGELTRTLAELGFGAGSAAPARHEIEVDLWDSYREIANVAVGRAADLLARYLQVFVEMPIPHVSLIEPTDLVMILNEARDAQRVTVACQGFVGKGLAGEAMLVINDAETGDIASLMNYSGELNTSAKQELLLELSSMFISAALQGVGEQLDIVFSMGPPVVLGEFLRVDDIIEHNSRNWDGILMFEMQSNIENHRISCNLLLLFTRESVTPLNELVSYLAD